MDLEEWEFLPVPARSAEDTFLDFPDNDDDHHHAEFLKPHRNANQVIPLPIQLDPVSYEETKNSITASDEKAAEETDQDRISQVHFKKMKETEFADMKLDSPTSGNRGSPFHFEDKPVIFETKNSKPEKEDKMDNGKKDEQIEWEEKDNKGLNILKWGLSGIGAICSFGVVAATVWIIALGSSHKNHQHQKEKLRFEIYKDKRIKDVVHHATKLNQAITGGRGVPVDRAPITIGGYYEYL